MSSFVMLMAPTIPRVGATPWTPRAYDRRAWSARSSCSATARATGTSKNLFTGWVDVDLTDKGVAEAVARRRAARRARPAARRRAHVVQRRAIRTAELTLDAGRSDVDPGAPVVAAQRAPLRRAAGQGQGADAGRVRRGAVHAVAPLVRHAAAAAARRRPSTRSSTTPATPRCRPRCARAPSASPTSSPACCRTGTTPSSPTCCAGATVLVAAHGNSLRALSSTSTG